MWIEALPLRLTAEVTVFPDLTCEVPSESRFSKLGCEVT